MVNGKQHSVWFVPTGMKGLPQYVLLNFRLEFPKSDLTIYLPSGISEIFRQMVSTPVVSFPPSFARKISSRERRLGTRQARLRQGGLLVRSSNLPSGGENRARKWIILPCFSYSFYTFLNEKYVSHTIQSLDSKFEN